MNKKRGMAINREQKQEIKENKNKNWKRNQQRNQVKIESKKNTPVWLVEWVLSKICSLGTGFSTPSFIAYGVLRSSLYQGPLYVFTTVCDYCPSQEVTLLLLVDGTRRVLWMHATGSGLKWADRVSVLSGGVCLIPSLFGHCLHTGSGWLVSPCLFCPMLWGSKCRATNIGGICAMCQEVPYSLLALLACMRRHYRPLQEYTNETFVQ